MPWLIYLISCAFFMLCFLVSLPPVAICWSVNSAFGKFAVMFNFIVLKNDIFADKLHF